MNQNREAHKYIKMLTFLFQNPCAQSTSRKLEIRFNKYSKELIPFC